MRLGLECARRCQALRQNRSVFDGLLLKKGARACYGSDDVPRYLAAPRLTSQRP